MLKIRKNKKYGRGVYATRTLNKNEVVEISPVIVLDEWEAKRSASTIINRYTFSWKEVESAVALGFGGLFNHSKDSNITYSNNYKNNTIKFKTTRKIKKGEQLFIDYGYEPDWAMVETSTTRHIIEKNELIENNERKQASNSQPTH